MRRAGGDVADEVEQVAERFRPHGLFPNGDIAAVDPGGGKAERRLFVTSGRALKNLADGGSLAADVCVGKRVERVVEKQLEIVGGDTRRLHRRVAKFKPMVEHALPLGIVIPQCGLKT